MTVRNHNWYAGRSRQKYPLDDAATGISDVGTSLPHDIIADCTLSWLPEYGQFAFLSAVTVTDNIVTAIFSACDAVDAVTSFTPLAAVTIVQPVARFTNYAITPLQTGVAGFVAFGDLSESFSGTFAGPLQSLIRPACARPLHSYPVTSLAKKNRNKVLQGIVTLRAGNDVEIVGGDITVNDQPKRAIFVRLKAATDAADPLDRYRGPCDTRPESRTCGDAGIEAINEIRAPADGNLEIVFNNVVVAPYAYCNRAAAGVVLDQPLGIGDVCFVDQTYRFEGSDRCNPSDSEEPPIEPSSSDSSSSVSSSSSSVLCNTLPYLEDWSDSLPGDFIVHQGSFINTNADLVPVFASTSLSTRNLATTGVCFDTPRIEETVSVQVNIKQTTALHNAMLVLNRRLVLDELGARFVYFAVNLDRERGVVELLRYNGTTFVTENSVTLVDGVVYNHWYKLSVGITALSPTSTLLSVEVTGITDAGWSSVFFNLATNRYVPEVGEHGVGSAMSFTRFADFRIEAL